MDLDSRSTARQATHARERCGVLALYGRLRRMLRHLVEQALEFPGLSKQAGRRSNLSPLFAVARKPDRWQDTGRFGR
jgi:hypothetical protein